MRNIGLIIKHEYKKRLTQRSFIISTIVILALIVIASFVPTIIGYFVTHSNSQTRITVVNNAGSIGGLNGDRLTSYIKMVLNGTSGTTGTANGQSSSGKAQFVIQMASAGSIDNLKNQVKNGTLLLQLPLQAALLGSNSGLLNLSITGASITLLVLLLVYFILGFLLYATLFAAVGALVKRQDEVQNAVAPISMLLVAGYIVSFFGIYMPDAIWIKVISYVPFWTPTTMLVRIATGGVAP